MSRASLCATSALAMLAVSGCSKDPARPGTRSEFHGTPLTSSNFVEVGSQIFWSGSTGELIVSGSFGSAASGHLLAVHAITKATRVLDPTPSIPMELAPDGSAAYYNSIVLANSDQIFARRLRLAGSASPQPLDSCVILCFFLMKAAPDGDQVAVMALGDSLRIHRVSTGENRAVGEGAPLAFSPNSSQLLVNGMFDPLANASVLTLATGTLQPAGLVVPDGIAMRNVRWGTTGIEVLYVEADRKRVFLHRAGSGAATLIWSSPDTLEGPIAWSASGANAAVWTSRSVGTATTPAQRWELHVIDIAARSARTIAYAEVPPLTTPAAAPAARLRVMAMLPDVPPGGLVFSPDETHLAYTFFDGRVYRIGLSGSALALAR